MHCILITENLFAQMKYRETIPWDIKSKWNEWVRKIFEKEIISKEHGGCEKWGCQIKEVLRGRVWKGSAPRELTWRLVGGESRGMTHGEYIIKINKFPYSNIEKSTLFNVLNLTQSQCKLSYLKTFDSITRSMGKSTNHTHNIERA